MVTGSPGDTLPRDKCGEVDDIQRCTETLEQHPVGASTRNSIVEDKSKNRINPPSTMHDETEQHPFGMPCMAQKGSVIAYFQHPSDRKRPYSWLHKSLFSFSNTPPFSFNAM